VSIKKPEGEQCRQFFLCGCMTVGPIGLSHTRVGTETGRDGNLRVGSGDRRRIGGTVLPLVFLCSRARAHSDVHFVAGLSLSLRLSVSFYSRYACLGSQFRAAITSGRARYIVVSILGLIVVVGGLFMLFLNASLCRGRVGCFYRAWFNIRRLPESLLCARRFP